MTDLIREWWHCVIAPAVVILAVGLFAWAMPRQADAAEPEKPKVICVFTMDKCHWCDELKTHMRKWRMNRQDTYDEPAIDSYPTVFYETKDERGRTTLINDNGQNVRRGNYRLPEGAVTLVHWRTK